MIINKILYICLIIISILFYILFTGSLSFYIMVFVIALPFILKLAMLISRYCIKFDMKSETRAAEKNEKCRIDINIRNKTPFPFANCNVRINYKNKFADNVNDMEISVPVHPLTTETLSFYLSSDYCGILSVSIESVRIYDFIKLFSCKIKSESHSEIYILPNTAVSYTDSVMRTISSDESDAFSKHRAGDDPSEIFDLNDYLPGDKLSRIHWNLSSRQNKLITKYYSQGINSSVAVVIDVSYDIYVSDTVFDVLSAVSMFILSGENPFKLYIMDKENRIQELEITDSESLSETFMHILDNVKTGTFPEMIRKAEAFVEGNSKVYFISYGNEVPDDVASGWAETEISAILVNKELSQGKYSELENVKISEIPPGKYDEKILLM